MVHQDCRSGSAGLGAVAAKRLCGGDRVVDAGQALVVAAQGGGLAVVWWAGTALRAGDGADADAHCARTAIVSGLGSRG